MLISMPTGTSTILGVFQVIASSKEFFWRELRAEVEPRTTPDIAQVAEDRASNGCAPGSISLLVKAISLLDKILRPPGQSASGFVPLSFLF